MKWCPGFSDVHFVISLLTIIRRFAIELQYVRAFIYCFYCDVKKKKKK